MEISTRGPRERSDRADTIRMRVVETIAVSPSTKVLRLRAVGGEILPRYEAGSHIEVLVTLAHGEHVWNAYSMIGNPGNRSLYEIAVKREENGRGGSRYLHEAVSTGMELEVRRPRNGFSLDISANSHLLIAGGIGITPIYSLSCQLSRLKIRHRVIYCVRDLEDAPLLDLLAKSAFAAVECHADGGLVQGYYDFDTLLRNPVERQRIYVCGPQSFIRSISRLCERYKWHHRVVKSESFGGVRDAPHTTLTVHLAKHGKTITVQQPETILGSLLRHGLNPTYGCKRGECGICAVSVTKGVPFHRDMFLSDEEKKSEKYMCTCVSWGASAELTLDI